MAEGDQGEGYKIEKKGQYAALPHNLKADIELVARIHG